MDKTIPHTTVRSPIRYFTMLILSTNKDNMESILIFRTWKYLKDPNGILQICGIWYCIHHVLRTPLHNTNPL